MRTSTLLLTVLSSIGLTAASPTAFGVTEGGFPIKAVAVITGKVRGTVTLIQDDPNSGTKISYVITGNDPHARRGFHIHQFGDLTDGCMSAKGHYNPYNKEHGASNERNRHVGDLGNIKTNANGEARGSFEDPYVKLSGPTSVLGRSFVVHGGEDDEGRGASADSKKTGNAGGRNGCGVIGITG